MCFLNPYGFRCVVQLFPLFSHPKIRKNAMIVLKGTSFPRNSFLVGKSSVRSLPIAEADEMNVTLSVESSLGDLLQRLIDHHACFLAAMGAQGGFTTGLEKHIMGIDWINHPEMEGVPYQVKLLEGEIVGLKPWIFPWNMGGSVLFNVLGLSRWGCYLRPWGPQYAALADRSVVGAMFDVWQMDQLYGPKLITCSTRRIGGSSSSSSSIWRSSRAGRRAKFGGARNAHSPPYCQMGMGQN